MAKIERLERVKNEGSNMDALVVHFEPERYIERDGQTVPVPNQEFFTSYEEAMQEVEPGKPRFVQILEETRPKAEARNEMLKEIREGKRPAEEPGNKEEVLELKGAAHNKFIGLEIGQAKEGKKQ